MFKMKAEAEGGSAEVNAQKMKSFIGGFGAED